MSKPIEQSYPTPPAHVAPYVEALGFELAIEFLIRFGGSKVYYAKNPRNSAVVELVGVDRAKMLYEKFYGLDGKVPLANHWLAECLAFEGYSKTATARRLRVTHSALNNWLNSPPSSFRKHTCSFEACSNDD